VRTSFLPGLALWSLFPRPQSHGPTFWTVFYGKRLVNAVSLTTPAVSRVCFSFFFVPLTEFEHTSSSTHELRLFLSLRFICVTLACSARLRSSTQCCPPNISSITIDHDELFELPRSQGRRVS